MYPPRSLYRQADLFPDSDNIRDMLEATLCEKLSIPRAREPLLGGTPVKFPYLLADKFANLVDLCTEDEPTLNEVQISFPSKDKAKTIVQL